MKVQEVWDFFALECLKMISIDGSKQEVIFIVYFAIVALKKRHSYLPLLSDVPILSWSINLEHIQQFDAFFFFL